MRLCPDDENHWDAEEVVKPAEAVDARNVIDKSGPV